MHFHCKNVDSESQFLPLRFTKVNYKKFTISFMQNPKKEEWCVYMYIYIYINKVWIFRVNGGGG